MTDFLFSNFRIVVSLTPLDVALLFVKLLACGFALDAIYSRVSPTSSKAVVFVAISVLGVLWR